MMTDIDWTADITVTRTQPDAQTGVDSPAAAAPPAEATAAYVQALIAQGVSCLFLNPGWLVARGLNGTVVRHRITGRRCSRAAIPS